MIDYLIKFNPKPKSKKMTYQAIEELLPESNENPKVQRVLDICSEAFKDLAGFGTHVLKWKIETEDDFYQLPIIYLLRQVVELSDALSVTFKSSHIHTSKIIIRSLLEANLSLDWLLREDTKRRCLAFTYMENYRKYKYYRSLLPGTDEYKSRKEIRKKGRWIQSSPPIPKHVLEENIEKLTKLLNSDRNKEIKAFHDKLDKDKKVNFKWYSFFKGPGSLSALAERLNKSDWYEHVYSTFSDATHGTNLHSGNLFRDENGNAFIGQMKNPNKANEIFSIGANFAYDSYNEIVTKHIPEKEEEMRKWFQTFLKYFVERIEKFPIKEQQ
ncbi:DUF5677 domain-containing protein [Larkinella sp. VNQ87]|uniref:DUF5677 domain-containing protein n=1 Tax=Larkinella sp. VNQ87 TaxID=3400921 RepID=UPI003C0B0B59